MVTVFILWSMLYSSSGQVLVPWTAVATHETLGGCLQGQRRVMAEYEKDHLNTSTVCLPSGMYPQVQK